MKRMILAIAILGISVGAQAQWDTTFYTDDFGEPTTESFAYIQVKGTFSNSATTNSDCGFLLQEEVDVAVINIYPYNRSTKERWSESMMGEIKMKKPTGEIVTLDVFVAKSGSLLINKKNFLAWKEHTAVKGEYMVVFKYNGTYSKSSYKFKFNL